MIGDWSRLTPMQNILTLRDLHGRLYQYKGGIVVILLLQVLWAVIELIFPFLTQALVDQGIHKQDLDFIYLILFAQLMLFAGMILADYFKMWLVRNIGVRLNMQLINNYLIQILKKRLLFFNEHPYGVILQNLSDNIRIERFLTESYSNVINATVKLLIFGIVLYLFDWRVGLILATSVFIFFFWNFAFWRQREVVDKMTFETRATIRNNLLQIVNGITDVKLHNLEHNRLKEWKGGQNMLSHTRLSQLRLWQYYFGGVSVINQLRDIFILFFTAISVMNGSLTLGAMLAIQYILGRLNQPMTDIMQFVQDYQDAKLSMGRLASFTAPQEEDYMSDGNSPAKVIKADITFDGLFFSYKGTPAIKDISFQVPYGTTIAIVGESGSGKSTLMKLILKLLKPNEGKILVGKQRLRNIATDQWRANCSALSQEGFIFDASFMYNITLKEEQQQVDMEWLQEVVEDASLEKLIDSLEDGLQTKLGKTGKVLSKGQTQRVLLARALYKNTPYLFLDEPTSALDNITAQQVINNIHTRYVDRTVFLITHKVEFAATADYIFLMEEGKIVEEGDPQTLLNQNGKYSELWERIG